jgi:AraC family transcriptional regulator, transcriptional activator of pobA
MENIETLEAFYRRKLNWFPESLQHNTGHFNVFHLEPFVGAQARPIPYQRRDYYKIMLCAGAGRVHYANEVIQVHQRALSFSNPRFNFITT